MATNDPAAAPMGDRQLVAVVSGGSDGNGGSNGSGGGRGGGGGSGGRPSTCDWLLTGAASAAAAAAAAAAVAAAGVAAIAPPPPPRHGHRAAAAAVAAAPAERHRIISAGGCPNRTPFCSGVCCRTDAQQHSGPSEHSLQRRPQVIFSERGAAWRKRVSLLRKWGQNAPASASIEPYQVT